MPNINLPSGKTIYVSTYEYYFLLKEEDVDGFFQSCMADDLGISLEDPFCNKIAFGKLEIETDSGNEDDSFEDPYNKLDNIKF